MTGWGQAGPVASMAGHDIDYIAIGGALWSIGRSDSPPVPPLNLVGDFGGGGMMLAFGMVSALLEAMRSGQGQVVDAAMVDGAASLMTMVHMYHLRVCGTTSGAPTCSTPARTTTRSTRPPTASTWPWAGLRRKFYATLLAGLGLADDPPLADAERPRVARHEEACRGGLQTKTVTSGTRSLTAPTPAPPRFCRRGRRRSTRTTKPDRPSSKSRVGCSRPRRHASPYALVDQPRRRRSRGRTRCPGCSNGVLTKGPWPSCGRRAR